tara:strand:+ start:2876 stop:3160 length:285 start_codon:yes stop_codon:yes gene_type:complete
MTKPPVGSRWRKRMWIEGRYDYKTNSYPNAGFAPNRMSNSVLEILCYHPFVSPDCMIAFWVQLGGRDKRNYRIGEIRVLTLEELERSYREEVTP